MDTMAVPAPLASQGLLLAVPSEAVHPLHHFTSLPFVDAIPGRLPVVISVIVIDPEVCSYLNPDRPKCHPHYRLLAMTTASRSTHYVQHPNAKDDIYPAASEGKKYHTFIQRFWYERPVIFKLCSSEGPLVFSCN